MKTRKDNSFLEIKLLLRRKLSDRVRPAVYVDLFAGTGKMAIATASRFKLIHAVEKNPAKVMALKRAAREGMPITTHVMDNTLFVKERLPLIEGVTFMDFDAYGSPNRLIKEVMRVWSPAETAAIAVTDGARMAIARGSRMKLSDYRSPPDQEGRPSETGRVKGVTAQCYQAMVMTFWKELAGRRAFKIVDFVFAWKKGRMVLYYGLWIEPA